MRGLFGESGRSKITLIYIPPMEARRGVHCLSLNYTAFFSGVMPVDISVF